MGEDIFIQMLTFFCFDVKECVKYSLVNDTKILLITAKELKEVAEMWHKEHPDESFNLGFFKQNGRFDKSLLII